nr:hypothetical protein [Mesorhizobium sp.]
MTANGNAFFVSGRSAAIGGTHGKAPAHFHVCHSPVPPSQRLLMESTICSTHPQSELADVVGGKCSVRINNPVERECPGDMDVERA